MRQTCRRLVEALLNLGFKKDTEWINYFYLLGYELIQIKRKYPKSAMAEWFALRGLLLHIWMAEKDILNAELTLSSDWIELLRCGNMHVGIKRWVVCENSEISLHVSSDDGLTFRVSAADHGGDHRPADQGRAHQAGQETLRH